MADIRINALPTASPAVASDNVPIDGATTRKVTIANLVDVGRPVASQAQAEAGTDNFNTMTALTTAQAVNFYGLTKAGNLAGITNAVTARSNLGLGSAAVASTSDFATAAQGVLADGSAQKAQNLADLANKTTAKATLGMATRPVDVGFYGPLTVGNAAVLLATFQAAIDALPSGGGVIGVPEGDFSALVPGSLVIGSKAITFDCRNRTTNLPANMPGVVLRNGVFSLPETSIQADRNVLVNNYYKVGNFLSTSGVRQYVHHVEGFQPHVSGAPSELESRAYSFDLGTDQNDIVDAIRGMKGRVYATAGQANIRSIYGFAESSSGGTHTGLLTALLGTVYGNGRVGGDTVAIRGHVDGGTNAAFQAAGAKVGETNDPGFGYMVRTGTGGPLLPRTAGFSTHGGGTGVMYQGLRDNVDLTTIFEVGKTGKVLGQSFRTGAVTVADDAVTSIIPPSLNEGILMVDTSSADQLWATIKFRAAGTHLCRAAGTNGTLIDLSTVALTGTTGTDGRTTISCNNGVIQIENRMGVARQYVYTFLSSTS